MQSYAATHNVKLVDLRIGANNYHFAGIVETCVLDWLTSPSWSKNYCRDDSTIAPLFTSSNIAAQTAAIKTAILNVRTAMSNAGYADSSYTILVNTYWNPIPRGSGFRYPETGYTRQSIGGCGVWNSDADWANDTVVPVINNSVRNAAAAAGLSNIKILDMQTLMNGHRLCEKTVGLLEERRASPPGPSKEPQTSPSGSSRSVPSPPSSRRTSFLTVGLPATRLDPDGVSTFHMRKTRTEWAPSIPRGRWCSPGRLPIDGRHPPPSNGRSLTSARCCFSFHPDLQHDEASTEGSRMFARPSFSSPVVLGRNEDPSA